MELGSKWTVGLGNKSSNVHEHTTLRGIGATGGFQHALGSLQKIGIAKTERDNESGRSFVESLQLWASPTNVCKVVASINLDTIDGVGLKRSSACGLECEYELQEINDVFP